MELLLLGQALIMEIMAQQDIPIRFQVQEVCQVVFQEQQGQRTTGSGASFSVQNPYTAVYMYKRTA